MNHDSSPEHTQPHGARLWQYEQSTPLLGTKDDNGNEIVITTVAVYDLDRRILVVECLTPTGNERTRVDCSYWRGPSGAPGVGAAVRALVEFEDRVVDSVRAWHRKTRREDGAQ